MVGYPPLREWSPDLHVSGKNGLAVSRFFLCLQHICAGKPPLSIKIVNKIGRENKLH